MSCLCLYLNIPCNDRCTCLSEFSSYGCLNCCTYGSLEQNQLKAEQLKLNSLTRLVLFDKCM